MKKNITLLLVIFYTSNLLIAQKIQLDYDNPTKGFIELAQKLTSTTGKSVYFLKELKFVNTKAESDIYGEVYEKNNIIYANSFYTSNDKKAIECVFYRKNGKLELNACTLLDEQGTFLMDGKNLISGKGFIFAKAGAYDIRIYLYKDGKRQDDSYMVKSQINNNYLVRSVKNLNYGVFNNVVDMVVPAIYKKLTVLNDNLFIGTNTSDKTGVFDVNGKVIIPFSYDYISSAKCNSGGYYPGFNQSVKEFDFFLVGVNKKEGVYNKQGLMISPPVNNSISFNCGLAAVKSENGKYGYINKNAEIVIPFKFYDASGFMEGNKAWVKEKEGGKIYYIDTLGNKVKQ